eukprot:9473240-Pyramimonas_sp.AAC.1
MLLKPLGGILGASWRPLGRLFGPTGHLLGPFWGALGSLWAALGAVLGHLERSNYLRNPAPRTRGGGRGKPH